MSYMASRRTTITLCGLLLTLINLGSATAQTQGSERVRWQFQMDSWLGGQFIAVAPNGTVYASDPSKLQALTPDGDLLILLANWELCPPKGDRPADLDGDGSVGAPDLLILLKNWG